MALSRHRPGPMNRLAMMIVTPEPVARLAVLIQAGPGVQNVMPTIRLAVFLAVFSGVCISEPGELDVERCVSSVVSPKPGLMC